MASSLTRIEFQDEERFQEICHKMKTGEDINPDSEVAPAKEIIKILYDNIVVKRSSNYYTSNDYMMCILAAIDMLHDIYEQID
jgi:hypothetical protein